MSTFEDYYEILQVHPSAEPEVIKAAYERLARKYHPDVNGDPAATDRMKKLNIAYEVLGNPEKRRQYHAEWLGQKGAADSTGAAGSTGTVEPPRPVVDPPSIQFNDVTPGETRTAYFVIRNAGGPFERVYLRSPESWVKVANSYSLSEDDDLPMKVVIEAQGVDWGQTCTDYIGVRLDEAETSVRIDLQTSAAHSRQRPSGTATPVNASGQGNSSVVPEGVRGWSWGAFFLTWIWGIGNNVWWPWLLYMVPFVGLVMMFVAGAKGNEWAWRSKSWDSVGHFQRVQRNWAVAALVYVAAWAVLFLVLVVASLVSEQSAAR